MKWWSVRWTGRTASSARPCRWLPKGKGEFRVVSRNAVFLLTYQHGQGIHLSAVQRVVVGVYTNPLAGEIFRRPSMKKKVSAAAGGDARHLAPIETEMLSRVMPLVEHCCVRKYDDGDPRETGWVTLKVQGSAWVVQVKDPDSACSFSAVGETLDKALETAALLLGCDEAPWEPDTFLAASKARRKK